jgi:hypothetical protein
MIYGIAIILSGACVSMVDAGFALPTLKLKFRESVAVVVATAAFQLPLPAPFHPQIAQATVNQLADVGLKEFLVKDGRQFLRLAIPVGGLHDVL